MTDTNTDIYMQRMVVSNPLMEPTIRLAIKALELPSGSRGLDAGCELAIRRYCCQRQ